VTTARQTAAPLSSGAEVAVLSDLSEREQNLVRAARRGDGVDCDALTMGELATTEDPARVVRAELLRELLLGRRGDLDPCGVRLSGARITGDLDLSHVHAHVLLRLNKCVLDGPCRAISAMHVFLI
jgi:hypothetical protein